MRLDLGEREHVPAFRAVEDAAGVESPVARLVQVPLQVAGEAGPEPAPKGKHGSELTDLRQIFKERENPFVSLGNVSALLIAI